MGDQVSMVTELSTFHQIVQWNSSDKWLVSLCLLSPSRHARFQGIPASRTVPSKRRQEMKLIHLAWYLSLF